MSDTVRKVIGGFRHGILRSNLSIVATTLVMVGLSSIVVSVLTLHRVESRLAVETFETGVVTGTLFGIFSTGFVFGVLGMLVFGYVGLQSVWRNR